MAIDRLLLIKSIIGSILEQWLKNCTPMFKNGLVTAVTVLQISINITYHDGCKAVVFCPWQTEPYAVFQWGIWHRNTNLKSLWGTLTPLTGSMQVWQWVETWPWCLRTRPLCIRKTAQSGKSQKQEEIWDNIADPFFSDRL